MPLNEKTIAAGVLDILNVDGGITGTTTTKVVKDGDATASPLSLSTDRVGIGTTSVDATLHIQYAGVSDTAPGLKIESTESGSSTAPDIMIYRNSSSPAEDDLIGSLALVGRNDNSQDVDYCDIYARIKDVSDGTEDATLYLSTMVAGTQTATLMLNSGNVGIGDSTPAAKLVVKDDIDTAFVETTEHHSNAILKLANDHQSTTDGAACGIGFFLDSDDDTGNKAARGFVGCVQPADTSDATDFVVQLRRANATYNTPFRINNNGETTIQSIGTGTGPTLNLHTYGDFNSLSDEGCTLNFRTLDTNGTTQTPTGDFAQSGHIMGDIQWSSWNNTDSDYMVGAIIRAKADDTWADDSAPTELVFLTTDTSAVSPTQRMAIKKEGKVGIVITDPDGKLHVHTATAGSVTPHADFDDLIVENSANAGITVLSPNDATAGIAFGSPEPGDGIGAAILWKSDDNLMTILTHDPDDMIAFRTGESSQESMRIKADGRVGIRTELPTAQLHIDQTSTSGAIPVLKLDQGDIDDSFIDFVGTSAADGSRSISSDTTSEGAKFGAIAIEINGVRKWIRVYDDHS